MVPSGNVVTLLNIKTFSRMLMKPALWTGAIGFGSSHKKASTAILALYQSPKRSVITHEFFPPLHPSGPLKGGRYLHFSTQAGFK